MMEDHRNKELVAIGRFIMKANIEELAMIINEIQICHDNLLAFNLFTASLDKVNSVSINGEYIQLNLENK